MSLPIPIGSPLNGDLPVRSADDVVAQWPQSVRAAETAPVRDALAEAMTAMFQGYQQASSYAVQQSDPTTATGQYLEEVTAGVGIFAQEGEDAEQLRDRFFSTPDVVRPQAILDLANSILGRYTSALAQLSESVLDRWYLFDGTLDNPCHSYVTDGTASVTPSYPDRRYDERPQRSPTGALPFADHAGRMFVLRVPDIGESVAYGAYADDGLPDPGGSDNGAGVGMFVSDGTSDLGYGSSYVFQGGAAVNTTYQQLANAVDQLIGAGVRWVLWVDPKLV